MFSKYTYIPQFVKKNLKWYERDGLITYINELEYKKFEEDRDQYLKNVNILNFDIIHNKCRVEPLENSFKNYKTVNEKDLKQMPLADKDAALAACFRSERKDLFVEKILRDEYFRTWYNFSNQINSSSSSTNSSSSGKYKFYKDKEASKKKKKKYFDSW